MAVSMINDSRNFRFSILDFRLAIQNLKSTIQNSQRGQSAIEYAVAVTVLVAALVGMSVYMKRALSGKWRQVGDSFGYGRQYDPCATSVDGGPSEKSC